MWGQAPPIPAEFKRPKKSAKQKKAEELKKSLNLPVKEKKVKTPSTAPVRVRCAAAHPARAARGTGACP